VRLALAIAALGGLGAVLRYLVDLAVTARLGRHVPWGTMTVNVLGSGFGGIIIGATTYRGVSNATATVLLVGLLGGFTTASTISYENVRLFEVRRMGAGLTVLLGTAAASLGAGLLGLWLGMATT